MMATVNPFDLRAIFLAKHAQHVALVHFPIALFISAVAFDALGQRTGRRTWLEAAYYNLLLAAFSTLPVVLSGVLAWRLALDGEHLKGILLCHLILGGLSSALIWLSWWIHFRARRKEAPLPMYRLIAECPAVILVILTGHLGGYLSGVNQ